MYWFSGVCVRFSKFWSIMSFCADVMCYCEECPVNREGSSRESRRIFHGVGDVSCCLPANGFYVRDIFDYREDCGRVVYSKGVEWCTAIFTLMYIISNFFSAMLLPFSAMLLPFVEKGVDFAAEVGVALALPDAVLALLRFARCGIK